MVNADYISIELENLIDKQGIVFVSVPLELR